MVPVRACLSLLLPMLLGGCLSGEAVLALREDGAVAARAEVSVSRAAWTIAAQAGTAGADFCRHGRLDLTAMAATCRFPETVVLDGMAATGTENLPFARIEARSDEIVTVRVPVRALWDRIRRDRPLTRSEAAALDDAGPLLASALDGEVILLAVEGVKVIRTNGEISADGRRASFGVPVLDLVEGNDLPREFFAELRYRPCRNAFLCR
jgi:hypothetical protein